MRLFLSGSTIVWSMLRSADRRGTPNVVQASNATTAVTFGATQHVVASRRAGRTTRSTSTATRSPYLHQHHDRRCWPAAGVLLGSILMDATYELAIGDPSITAGSS